MQAAYFHCSGSMFDRMLSLQAICKARYGVEFLRCGCDGWCLTSQSSVCPYGYPKLPWLSEWHSSVRDGRLLLHVRG